MPMSARCESPNTTIGPSVRQRLADRCRRRTGRACQHDGIDVVQRAQWRRPASRRPARSDRATGKPGSSEVTYSGWPIEARWPIRSTLPNVAAREAPITTARPGNGCPNRRDGRIDAAASRRRRPGLDRQPIIVVGTSATTSSTPSRQRAGDHRSAGDHDRRRDARARTRRASRVSRRSTGSPWRWWRT